MANICDILFNSCCCCCQRRDQKKIMIEQKRKTLQTLERISKPESDVWKKSDSPYEVPDKQIAETINVPEQYKTEGDVFVHKGYKLQHVIGKGGFACVQKGVHISSGIQIACKQIEIPVLVSDKQRTSVFNDIKSELFVLQKTRHPHVIRMIEFFCIDNRITKRIVLNIMMRFAPGGDLSDRLARSGPFKEDICKQWLAQMLSALSYMHEKGIAHRDLKLANILLDEVNDVLITDFGFSRLLIIRREGTLFSRTICGTEPFMGPELLELCQSKNPGGYDAFKVDVWALGVILFRLFTKRYPFPADRKGLKRMKQKKWKISSKLNPSPHLLKFLESTFDPNPKTRSKMKDLSNNRWIHSIYREVNEKSVQKMKTLNNLFYIED